jgi:type IV pilus assembly protein PilE
MPKTATPHGFTLIELMVVVVIAGLLLGIALPSYQDSVRRGRRSDAADAAVGVLQAQERWRGQNASYSGSLSSLNQPTTSTGGYYSLALSAATGAGYTLTATGVSGKGQDHDTGCTSLVITVAGGSPTYTPAGCWSR